jgi:hypothetical protein
MNELYPSCPTGVYDTFWLHSVILIYFWSFEVISFKDILSYFTLCYFELFFVISPYVILPWTIFYINFFFNYLKLFHYRLFYPKLLLVILSHVTFGWSKHNNFK